jgi:hypothetical protein
MNDWLTAKLLLALASTVFLGPESRLQDKNEALTIPPYW